MKTGNERHRNAGLLAALCACALFLGGCLSNLAPTDSENAGNLAVPAYDVQADRTGSGAPDIFLKPIGKALVPSNGRVAKVEAPVDLWERMCRDFSMPDLQSDQVLEREQWYIENLDKLNDMAERSRKYIFHVTEELEARGMPGELALLPYIESAFNPQAVSRAKAAGMWQFMPATGTAFNLKQNAFRDDRRDVVASTTAALDYLQYLYDKFGDWHLALAAYNWGEGNVGRAIAKNMKEGRPATYTELTMPEETRLYVPKLQALKNIVQSPDKYAVELPAIGNHPYFQIVDINRDMDVKLVVRLADVQEQNFRELNPAIKGPVIMVAVTPEILLPWENAELFKRNLEAHKEGQFASWTAWRVPRTMGVEQISDEVGMSVPSLRAINNIPSGMLVRAGSTLIVPRTAKINDDVAANVANSARLELSSATNKVSAQPKSGIRRLVPARKRETVKAIAQRFGVRPQDVSRWNKVSVDAHFNAGHKVLIYMPEKKKK